MTLKLCSWNISSIKDKMESDTVLKYIIDFDLIFLSETKTSAEITVPGFHVYSNPITNIPTEEALCYLSRTASYQILQAWTQLKQIRSGLR